METVGFIGLGNMGTGMAGNIIRAGYPVVVHDKREARARAFMDRGARRGRSPVEVARLAEVVFTSLPGPSEVEDVALGPEGILAGIGPGDVYVDLSTSRPTLIRRIESSFRAKGRACAGCAGERWSDRCRHRQSGGDGRRGEREVYERIKPILDALGDKVFYAGTIGAGSVCKLVHNLISHTVRQAIAEGLTLGVKAGVEAEPLWECVRRGAVGRSQDLHERLPRTMFRGEFEPAKFALELLCKDLGLATELARECDVPLPISSEAVRIAEDARDRGWGHMDDVVFVRLQEEAAGVEVRAPDIDLDRARAFISTHPDA